MSYTTFIKRLLSLILITVLFVGASNICITANAVEMEHEEDVSDILTHIINRPVQSGSSGEDVVELQTMLNRILDENMVVDGFYGPITEDAVKRFQEKYNLEVNGKDDDSVRKEINLRYTLLAAQKKIMVRVNSFLNVRKGPGTEYPIIGEVHNTEVYTVYIYRNNWYLIKTDFGPGWISASFAITDFTIIDISGQYLLYYEGTKEIIYTPVVTGCVNNGWDTPTGIYSIFYKSVDIKLMGDALVDFWMNFVPSRAIGCHDAYRWRTSYGGNIYIYSGSHGCVNMPLEAARILYDHTILGTTIVVRD